MGFSYEYDAAGQLLWEDTANAAFLPQPSAVGETKYGPASPINALTTVGTVVQEHDLRGSRTRSATRTWRYDTRNRLVGAQAPGVTAAYGYYPEAGRAWKQVNGVTSLYLEVDGLELAQLDGAGAVRQRYIRSSGAGGAVIATRDQSGLTWLHPNRQGSVIAWTGPNAALRGTASYDAYGNSAQDAAAGPAFRYAGMRLDAETGLYHTPNRAYDPRDGRWMQLDPIGVKDGLNRYAYVRNSPTNFVDPTGLYGDLVVEVVSIGVGAKSAFDNFKSGNIQGGLVDSAGVTADIVLAVVPGAPGAVGLGIQSTRQAERVTQLAKNVAKGKEGEALTRAKLGDNIAGEKVSFRNSDGSLTNADFVTKDGRVVETKTGNAELSSGQQKLHDDIASGREVTPVGQNAERAGLSPGKKTEMKSCSIDRPC
ncbi:MAG TPA: RHS repeat-associated core domain-containing protein [Azospirillaceae bacterium]|nr:RHS repeat-associated core domain-containing protein [Azospirillaceae bacterium]